MTNRSFPALVAAVALAACGLLAPAASSLEGDWILERGTHGGVDLPLLEGAPVNLRIEGSDVGGTAACNIYGGTVERDGDAVSFSALTMTEMGCDEPRMTLESAYIAALADVEAAVRNGDRLSLTGPDVELSFRLSVPPADASLVGTSWVLDSLVAGDAVSSVIDMPAIEFGDDGVVTGDTGCRAFDGSYDLDGTELTIENLVVEDVACAADLAAQDEHVLAVLGRATTVEIEGNRLSLTGASIGLGYRVADG
jgi:heat shock protein HslJ